MSIVIVIGSIIIPMVMVLLAGKWSSIRYVFNILSLISGLVFGNIAAVSVYKIIRDQAVFMTKIHAVFLDPFFLAAGAYLGVFLIYQLFLITMKSDKRI